MDERRRNYRLPISDVASLHLRLPDLTGALAIRVLNISKAGIKFEKAEGLEFDLGESIDLRLYLNRNVSLAIKCEVRRIDEDGFAAEFIATKERSLEAIEFLCSFLEIVFEQKRAL